MPQGNFSSKSLAAARQKFHAAPTQMGGGLPKLDLGAPPRNLVGKKPPLMLLDGDIIVFHIVTTCLVETYHRDRDGYTWEVDMRSVRAGIEDRIQGLARWMKAAKVIIAFSSGRAENFRRKLLKTYKADRTGKKPLAYYPTVEEIKKKYECLSWPGLEADDVLGVLATLPENRARFTPVIVSDDKDMLTIPSHHLRLKKPEDPKMHGVFEISASMAEFYHMRQTLSGDAGDGYRGLEGVGPKKAEAILEGATPGIGRWRRVVAAYQKAGLTAADALTQARMARILQATEFNPAKPKELKLWTPPLK